MGSNKSLNKAQGGRLSPTDRPKLVADLVVKALEDVGIKVAFGIPGGAIVSIFDALSRSEKIDVVLTQHECSAAYMAMGRSLASLGQEVGFCFATSGPGITNLITGVAAAYMEKVPIFVLTGNVSSELRGKGAVQDAYESGVDAVKMLEPVTLSSATIFDDEILSDKIKSMYLLGLKHQRPVHLNIPVNLASTKLSRFISEPNKKLLEVGL